MLRSPQIALRSCAIALITALLALAPVSRAQQLPRVRVQCTALSAEAKASVEARARADLAVKGIFQGTLEARCGGGIASAHFEPPRGAPLSEAERLADTENARVEQLLALIDKITTRVAEPYSAPARAGKAGAASAAGGNHPEVPGDAAVSAPADGQRKSRSGGERFRRRLELGAVGHYWDPDVFGGAGPRATLGVELGKRFTVGFVAGAEWGIRRPDGLKVRLLDGAVEAWWQLAQPMSVVIGAGVAQLRVAATPTWSPYVRKSWAPLLRIRLQWEHDVGPFALALGPEIQSWGKTRTVSIDERVSFRLPLIVGGLYFAGRRSP